MNRGSAGIGSASVVLMFTVLCMAIFALISHTSARNDMALAQAEAELVKGYYEADAMAERMAAELAADPNAPETAEFTCEISDNKELYVKLAISGGAYDILVWRMRDTEEWRPEGGLPVWPGTF